MRAGSTHLRVEPSGPMPPPPSSTSDASVEASSAATVDTNVPPPTTSDDSNIRHTLDHVWTIQVTYRQILVDVLDEIRAL